MVTITIQEPTKIKKTKFKNLIELYRYSIQKGELSKEDIITEFDLLPNHEITKEIQQMSKSIDFIKTEDLYNLK